MKVLVTDASYKHSLAAIRALGREGVEVIAASHLNRNPSFHSKYCKKHYRYSDPGNETEFVADLLYIIKKEKCDVLLPIGFKTGTIVCKHQNDLSQFVKIPIVNYGSMQIASDKNRTMQFASEHGIAVPNTTYPKTIEEIEEISKKLQYPVVIKAPEETGSVKYANTPDELKEIYRRVCNDHPDQIKKGKLPQIQEYIPGEGYGFFALYDNGTPNAIFAHQRVHEYPPTGGPSTMAKSIHDSELNRIGLKLLNELNWHGVAMVEFKKDSRDNTYKLMEINPKFWGSLDLAIRSGVNFPYLASKMCRGEKIDLESDYEDITFRWVGPDLIYSIANNSLKEFLLNFSNDEIIDDLDLKDIKPTLLQLIETGLELTLRIKNKNLRNIHGVPDYKDI